MYDLMKVYAMHKFSVPFRIHGTGCLLIGSCLLIGIWLRGWGLGFAMGGLLVASLLMHEAGHMLVAIKLGVPVREFGLRLSGAYNRRAYATNRRDEVLISMAGPLTNLCLAIPFLFVPGIGTQLALGNLALCVVNLLPIPSSDGLHILQTLLHSSLPGDITPKLGQHNSALGNRAA
jgi:Zn-dependent protease